MIAAWIFGLASIALMLALANHLRTVKPRVNKAQVTFTESGFRHIVRQWSPDQLAKVRSHFLLDYAFLVAYGGFGLSLAMALQHHVALPGPFATLIWPWVLPLAAFCDALENVLHQRFLRETPDTSPEWLFVLSGCAASAKWVLLVVYLVILGMWVMTPRSAP
jgi:hypothetical protein